MAGEEKYFVKGNKLSTCKLQGREIATFICYDLRFPAVFQALGDETEIVVVAANWPKNEENIGSVCFRHGQLKTRFTFGRKLCG